MTQTTLPPVRARARALAFASGLHRVLARPAVRGLRPLGLVVAVSLALGVALGCAQTKRALGDECLKSEDCLSGICSQLLCAASPPLTSSQDNAEAGSADTGPTPEASVEAAVEAAVEGGGGGSDGGDGAAEASSD